MKRLFVIGDSISIQYGPYLEEYLSGWMGYARKEGSEAEGLDMDPPQGPNGLDSGAVLAYLEAKKKAGGVDADALMLNCGLHDIKKNPESGEIEVPIEQYRRNLERIIEVVRSMSVDLIWVRCTPCDEAVHNRPGIAIHRFAADAVAYNAAADAIMKAAGVPLIDLYSFTLKFGKEAYCDHVHFTDDVRRLQAAFIAGWLSRWDSGS